MGYEPDALQENNVQLSGDERFFEDRTSTCQHQLTAILKQNTLKHKRKNILLRVYTIFYEDIGIYCVFDKDL